jgi:fibronectin type 3 domain-containing protein
VKAERLFLLTVVSLCSAGVQLWAISVCSLVPPSSAFAAQITLGWDTNNDPAVAGYILYYRSANGQYEEVIDVGMQDTYTLTDLEDGKPYYFAITAYDMDGNESEISEEIVHDHSMADPEVDQEENSLIDGEDANADEGSVTKICGTL